MRGRQSFNASRGDRGYKHDLPESANDLPETVTVDLDAKDPEQFEIVEIDDTPEADRGRPTDISDLAPDTGEEPATKSGYQKRIDRLKAETNTERRAREAVERERDAAIEFGRRQAAELEDLRARAATSTTALADSMKAERTARLEDAKRRLAQAHSDGDSAAIAQATEDMGMAQAELVQIAARTPAARTAPPVQQPPPQQRQQAPNIAPNVAAWISHNDRWFNKDRGRTDFALAAHSNIIGRGIQPASPEYTRELDKALKAVYPDHVAYEQSAQDDDRGGQPTPRRTNVVADGSRATERQQPSNPRTVELTRSELSIAKRLGVSPQAYAAQKAKQMAKEQGAR